MLGNLVTNTLIQMEIEDFDIHISEKILRIVISYINYVNKKIWYKKIQ